MKPVDGGGSRFITIHKDEDPDFRMLAEKALDIFFPLGENSFIENVEDVDYTVKDFSQANVNLDGCLVRQYLKDKGLFSSRTWFFVITSLKDCRENGESIENYENFVHKDYNNGSEYRENINRKRIRLARVECPLCFSKFDKECIEAHAATCNVIGITNDSDDDDLEKTSEYGDQDDTPSEISEREVMKTFNELFDSQREAPVQSLRILRHKAFATYIEHCSKKWFKQNATLQVTFIGEFAVGEGPRREFFQGIYFLDSFLFFF